MIAATKYFVASLAIGLANVVGAVNCVSGFPPSNADASYTDHGNGTVTDLRTGLMWSKCVEGQDAQNSCTGTPTTRTWSAALGVAAAQQLGGYADWRLPNVKELRTLAEACRVSPAINDAIFLGAGVAYVWSGTTVAANPSQAWRLNLDYGDSEKAANSISTSIVQ